MTPAIYARVAPLLTVYSGQARPDPNFASGQVLQALGEDPEPILARRKARVPSPDEAFLGGGSGTDSSESRARPPRNGRAPCMGRVGQIVEVSGVAATLTQQRTHT